MGRLTCTMKYHSNEASLHYTLGHWGSKRLVTCWRSNSIGQQTLSTWALHHQLWKHLLTFPYRASPVGTRQGPPQFCLLAMALKLGLPRYNHKGQIHLPVKVLLTSITTTNTRDNQLTSRQPTLPVALEVSILRNCYFEHVMLQYGKGTWWENHLSPPQRVKNRLGRSWGSIAQLPDNTPSTHPLTFLLQPNVPGWPGLQYLGLWKTIAIIHAKKMCKDIVPATVKEFIPERCPVITQTHQMGRPRQIHVSHSWEDRDQSKQVTRVRVCLIEGSCGDRIFQKQAEVPPETAPNSWSHSKSHPTGVRHS